MHTLRKAFELPALTGREFLFLDLTDRLPC